MPDWVWFLIAGAVGGVLLLIAVVFDVRARRRATGAGQPAPRRNLEEVDRHVPSYVTQDDIDAMPSPATGSEPVRRNGEGFAFGHAHPDFATSGAGAAWANARVLVVDGTVSAMRELLDPISHATPQRPLVVVAAELADEVVTTLAANRRALRLPVVAATASPSERLRLAELVGATQLLSGDLQAGYVPDKALGHAACWSSTTSRCWVKPSTSSST